MTDTMTTDAHTALRTRVYFCRGRFHVWISAGPHHSRQLCNCGRVEWQHCADCLERIGPPIFVNGVEVGQLERLAAELQGTDSLRDAIWARVESLDEAGVDFEMSEEAQLLLAMLFNPVAADD